MCCRRSTGCNRRPFPVIGLWTSPRKRCSKVPALVLSQAGLELHLELGCQTGRLV